MRFDRIFSLLILGSLIYITLAMINCTREYNTLQSKVFKSTVCPSSQGCG